MSFEQDQIRFKEIAWPHNEIAPAIRALNQWVQWFDELTDHKYDRVTNSSALYLCVRKEFGEYAAKRFEFCLRAAGYNL